MEALLQNRILIAAGIAWAVSQISKTILHTIINGTLLLLRH